MSQGVHINGQTRDGRGPVIELTNPATGEVFDSVTTASAADVAEAVAAAIAAQPGWAARTPGERAKLWPGVGDGGA